MSPAEARLKEVPSGMTDAEWNQRINLAACYRLVAYYGWDDLVDTHISARVPGPEHHFLINPYGLMFDEITASSLVKIDLDGNQLTKSEYSINPAGFTIHSAIHEVREDAGCVLHLHTPDGTAVASCMEGLLPLNQTAQFVTHDLAYHDYEGVALDHDERPRLQNHAGTHPHAGPDRLSGRTGGDRQERAGVFQCRSRGVALDAAGMAAAAAQARPPRPELQDLKIPDLGVFVRLNDLCTSNPNAAQFRAAFLLCGRFCRRLADISYFARPYDLEPLEHGFDFVIHLKTLSSGSPPEEAAMSGQPPLAGALALAFIPGKSFIDRIQRSDPEFRRAPNRARATSAIEQDDVAPDDRRRLPVRTKLAS